MPRVGIAFTRFCRFAHRILGPLRCKTESDDLRRISDWEICVDARKHSPSILGRLQETLQARKSLEDNLLFAGLGLRPEEVISGGRLALILPFPLLVAFVLVLSHPIYLGIILIPLLVQRMVLSYPATLASRIEKSSFKEAPEVISYLIGGAGEALSYENPTLTIARNSDGRLGNGFRRMIWLVYTKGRNLSGEFRKHAQRWRSRNEGFGEALNRFSEMTGESGRNDLGSLLAPVHLHSKRRLKEFLSSLKAPINVVFAIGIVLPVMIASMLPMSSLAVANPVETSPGHVAQSPGVAVHPALIAIVLDVVFPLTMFLYCKGVLTRRPFSTLHTRPLRFSDLKIPLIALLLALVIFSVGIILWLHFGTPLMSLAILVSASVTIALVIFLAGRSQSDRRSRELSEEFAMALESLGDSLMSGEPLEIALLKTARRMKGTETSRAFTKALFLLSKGGSDVGGLVCGTTMLEAPDVNSILRMIVDIASKDAPLAGRTAKHISSNMKEISAIERDAKDEIKPIVQTVTNTITIFSPLVLGVTASMFLLMEMYFSESGGLTSFSFILILGVLLYCNMTVASYFTEGLWTGDYGRTLKAIGKGLVLSTLVFVLSFLMSALLFGVL